MAARLDSGLKHGNGSLHNREMQLFQKRKWVYAFTGMCFSFAGASLYWTFRDVPVEVREARKINELREVRSHIAEQIGPSLLHNQWPTEIQVPFDGDLVKGQVEYTIDPDLQQRSERLLKTYKPDYGAIVMMDASTGQILALSSFTKDGENTNLALRGTFPAASIFKIVTATAAVDKYDVTPDTILMFNGANHTLYRKNVMSDQVTRWTRRMALREAFARSVNTAFGRLTLEHLAPEDLEEYAIRFGFNTQIRSDIPFDGGVTEIPKEKNFHLTELASGFNKVTRMSPVQGAMIAGSIADDGVMRIPYIVERVRGPKGQVLFQSEPVTAAVTMTPSGADKLKEMMEATITEGTSKKAFRALVRDRKFKELIVGGKTGSLTGDNPRGKTDWFVGYAMNENQKIAIAALTVNVDYWTVKSAYLAQDLFKAHFKEQFSRNNEKFFNASNHRESSADEAADQ